MKRLLFPFLMFVSSFAFGWTPVSSAMGTIQNRSTLQSGSTFYVSSGTVDGSFNLVGDYGNVVLKHDAIAEAMFYDDSLWTHTAVGDNAEYAGLAIKSIGNDYYTSFKIRPREFRLDVYDPGVGVEQWIFTADKDKIGYGVDASFGDNISLYLGSGNDLRLYHNGTNSYITNITGTLNISTFTSPSVTVTSLTADDIIANNYIITTNWYIYSPSGGDFSGFSREEDATGRVILSDDGGGFYTDSPIAVGDNGYFYAGDGGDLQIYHNGSNGYIDNLIGSLSTRNINTSPITGGKLIYSSSFTNVSTTGNLYGVLTNSYISGGTSNPGGSPVYITSLEDMDLVLSTVFQGSFNSYVGKKFDITLTGIPGTGSAGLGTSAYGVQYSVNATGSFNGNFVTLLAPILNSVTLTSVVAGGSGFTSLVENNMSLLGTCSITQLHGISLTMNMGSGSTIATLRGIYLSMGAGTTIATNESYGIYSYNTTGGAGYFSYPTFYSLYLRSGYGSTMNGIGVYTEIENDGCGSWSFLTGKGDSVIRELYVGLPYRGTTGVTGGDLKADIVVNEDFASDTAWNKGTGWTITGGAAVKAAGTASNLTPTTPLVPSPGRVYYVQMAWTAYTAGSLSIQFGGQTYNILRKANNQQAYFYVKAISSGTLTLVADSAANYSINYIFIREVGDSNLYMAEGKLNFWDTNNYIKSNSPGMIDISVSTGVRIGTYTANYTMFTSSGYQTMVGEAQPWDDLRIEPVARTTGANAPTFEVWATTNGWRASTGSRGVYLYTFDDANAGSEKEVMFTMQMPHDWNQSNINFHVHWAGRVNDTTAAPRWGLEYAWKEPGAVYSTTTIIYSDGSNYTASGTDVNVSSGTHYLSKFAIGSPNTDQDGLSSILIGRLFRDSANAGDTYNATNADCGLLYIDAHYRRNKIGSQTEY